MSIRIVADIEEKLYLVNVQPEWFIRLERSGKAFEITLGSKDGSVRLLEDLNYIFEANQEVNQEVNVSFILNNHRYRGKGHFLIRRFGWNDASRLTIVGMVEEVRLTDLVGVEKWGVVSAWVHTLPSGEKEPHVEVER